MSVRISVVRFSGWYNSSLNYSYIAIIVIIIIIIIIIIISGPLAQWPAHLTSMHEVAISILCSSTSEDNWIVT